MIIARLKGGLGNQLFIYALARHLSIKNKSKLFLDTSYLKTDKIRDDETKYFNVKGKRIPILFNLVIPHRIFFKIIKILSKKLRIDSLYPRQKDYHFDKEILNKNVFVLDEYWVSEKYFKDIEEVIKKDFTLKGPLDEKNKTMLNKIRGSNNSICLHVRRGDIAVFERGNEVGRLLSLDYQYNALKKITKNIKNPNIFVFTDDKEYVKKNFKSKFKTTYVDINGAKEGYKDLNLMKNCDHFIIANSTFSWWAAWLSENKNKIIIAPKDWFKPVKEGEIPKNNKKKWPFIRDEGDIVPENWIRVQS